MQRRHSEPHGQDEQLVRHIGFAQRWLARAKQEVTDGQIARSILTLLLAEAEVHHARERTLPAREAALPRPSVILTTILAATALAAVLLAGRALLFPRDEMVTGFSSAPTVVRFKQPGSTLALVPAVLVPESPAPAIRVPAALPRADRVWRNTVRPASTRPAVRTRSTPPAVAAPAAPALVSDGDLIDIVIAAERSLRGEKR